MSAGICVTRPSPTESLVKTSAALASGMPWRVTPMTMPPKMLTARMMRPAMASPRTNFEAPSIEPKKALSSSSSRRRRLRLLVVDQAGREVGVDRHLLAGDGVEREAGADFGDARRALGDDEEVDRDQDQEDDDADDEIAAHDEPGEAADDVAGRGRPLGAVRQDERGWSRC